MRTIEKHMDLFTTDSIKQLLMEREGPCLSIYMPTHRAAPEVQQNPIRFKNLLNEAREKLSNYGVEDKQLEALLAPVLEETDSDFWQYTSDGLAVFLAPDVYLSYRVPHSFETFVFVGENFHVRQMLPLVAGNERFYVLTLNQENARLLQGSRYQIGEVDLDDVPQSLSEALRFDQFEKQVQMHSTANSTPGGQDALFHGHGAQSDDAVETENILRFFRALDNGVCDYLDADNGAPLILAGIDSLRGLYRQANHYDHLMENEIETDPQPLDEQELHQRAWAIVEPDFDKEVADAIDRFHALAGNDAERVAKEVKAIVPAAYYKRVDTLFVPKDKWHWGVFDPHDNTVKVHDAYQIGDHDLLNDAAIYTLNNGGTVHTVDSDDVSIDEAAATLRF